MRHCRSCFFTPTVHNFPDTWLRCSVCRCLPYSMFQFLPTRELCSFYSYVCCYKVVFSLGEESSAEFRCGVNSKQEFFCASAHLLFSSVHPPFLLCASTSMLFLNTSLFLSAAHRPPSHTNRAHLLQTLNIQPNVGSLQQSRDFADTNIHRNLKRILHPNIFHN